MVVGCVNCKRGYDGLKMFDTKKGLLCKDCFCIEMGDEIEKNPIASSRHVGD